MQYRAGWGSIKVRHVEFQILTESGDDWKTEEQGAVISLEMSEEE